MTLLSKTPVGITLRVTFEPTIRVTASLSE